MIPVVAPGVDYRPDVDGLRGIAVAAVILFHAGAPLSAGGFFGVDVFFVVSGFLITRQLTAWSGMNTRALLQQFYLRRARRILPALFVMLAVTVPVFAWLLLPADFERFGRSLALSVAFLGNLAAWLGGGYFETGTAPLLHLWSLGVEEQFYLVYPFLLILCARHWPGRAPLVTLAAVSFAGCVWASDAHPFVNFLFTPFRGWELLAGAIAARSGPTRDKRAVNDVLAVLCLAVLLYVLMFSLPGTIYPGWHAIVACLATCGLIVTGQHAGVVRRVLSLRPAVFTGLISYSLYLWHVPVFAGLRYFSVHAPDTALMAAALALVWILSVISWRFVERPIRQRRLLADNKRFTVAAVAAAVLLTVAGVIIAARHGFPGRFSARVQVLAQGSGGLHPDIKRCTNLDTEAIAAGQICRFGPASHDSVLVWGDSHAMMLLSEYELIAQRRQVTLYLAAVPSCRPLIGVQVRAFPAGYARRCEEFNRAVVQAIRRLDPQLVILNGFWSNPSLDLESTGSMTIESRDSVFSRGVQESLRRIAAPQRRVCAVLDPPDLPVVLPYALAMAERRGMESSTFSLSRLDALEAQRPVRDEFHELARRHLLTVVDLLEPICRGERCLMQAPGGAPLYNDSNHLSAAGARWVNGELDRCFAATVVVP